ncbi:MULTISPECIES: hypothetical protein [Gammaproteobacteria]|uniref:hypothetical protein n=1 Tax=Gammaproteobacteria TaxID=1236 RepID=UPI0019113B08|nr:MULTISPECIES: hypothetical protein [Gammaproteobacteria]MBK5301271.1 hypothetical protein [Bacillus sp. TH86]MBK5321040.1 hypothetical protein [Bacillus sp. TH59]MBK5335990.1 hypothetical protein [Bacillus sp. TH57]MBK5310062.1 hypothetical protein [Pseudomonas sp. TH71]MBK5315539.1 hypothetical protein [Erwinia sp. TH79]
MTATHDQAMNYVYQQMLQRLLGFFSRAERTALQLMIQRLVMSAGGMERIGDYKVLAMQSGSRDSCYTLALLRAAQLSIAGRAPATFQLRVATLRLNGAASTALENIHRSCSALFLYDDPRVEVLMVDNREVLPFNHLASISEAGRESNRLNLLMVGHRRAWDGPLDLWDDGYLATGEFYGQIARWDKGVDALISSDTPRRQKQFLEGLNRAAAKAGLKAPDRREAGYEGLFARLDELGSDCYSEFYPESAQAAWRPAERFEACRRTTFIDIHDILVSNLEERWPLLTDFLGFQPDELSAQLSDNDYVSLSISAHIRGLQACYVHGRTYETGVSEYVQRALVMMRRKHVPERFCEQAMKTFGNPMTMTDQRALAAAEAQKNLGLSEAQLVCLLFAPFADNGAALEHFLRQCHPGMLVALPDLHRAMQGGPAPEQVLQWMVDVSGLSVSLIGTLYRMAPVVRDEGRGLGTESGEEGVQAEAVEPDRETSVAGEWSTGR